jgi:uncharacterized protein (DUF2126 family)
LCAAQLWNYFELFQAAKVFYPKEEKQKKNEEKDETLFEVDTFITAMCIEERDGMLYVFLPPTDYLEDYIDLVTQLKLRQKNYKCQYELKVTNPNRLQS